MANPNMPHGEDRINGNGIKAGYVVYNRPSNSPHWERTREEQGEKVENWYSAIQIRPTLEQYRGVGEYLQCLGEAEEKREKALIQSALGIEIDAKNERQFIENFNMVLVGKKQYEDAIHRINIALSEKDKAGLAPAISSLFASKLNTILAEKINKLIRDRIKNAKTPEDIEKAIDRMEEDIYDVFEQSFDQAIDALLSYQNASEKDDRFGSLKGYQDLLDLFNSNEIFREIYRQKIRKAFSDESIRNIIRNNRKTIAYRAQNSKKMSGHSWAKRALTLDTRAGQIGGLVNEIVNMLRGSMSDVTIGENGTRMSRTLTSNKLATDNVTVFQVDGKLNQEVIDEKLKELSTKVDATENLAEAHKVLMDYWKKNLSKIDKGFVVFQSAKAYRITNISKHGGFTNTNVSLNRLTSLPNEGSFNNIDMNKFIIVVANTIDGAILSEEYDKIREWLYLYIVESIAYLLFDDWEKIGSDMAKKGANAVHALLLNDVNVPFSVFLKGAGAALVKIADEVEKTNNFVNIVVHKSKALYDKDDQGNPTGYPTEKDDNGKVKVLVGRAWNNQRSDALQNYNITVKFYKNFNEEILSKIC